MYLHICIYACMCMCIYIDMYRDILVVTSTAPGFLQELSERRAGEVAAKIQAALEISSRSQLLGCC